MPHKTLADMQAEVDRYISQFKEGTSAAVDDGQNVGRSRRIGQGSQPSVRGKAEETYGSGELD